MTPANIEIETTKTYLPVGKYIELKKEDGTLVAILSTPTGYTATTAEGTTLYEPGDPPTEYENGKKISAMPQSEALNLADYEDPML
jgi:hypothetical protein